MARLVDQLRRVTVSTRYLPQIDGLRFLAIFAVVLVHLSDDLALRHHVPVPHSARFLFRVLSYRNRGVLLFFSISGFILALPFAARLLDDKPAPRLGAYFRRRLFRLEPPYAINIVVCAAAAWFLLPELREGFRGHLLAAFVYGHGLIFHYRNPINVVWWSLEVETQFYTLMPLLAQVFRVRNAAVRRTMLLLGAGLVIALQQRWPEHWIVTETLAGYLQYFLAGLLAADLYHTGSFRRVPALVGDAAGVAGLALLFLVPEAWLAPAAIFCFCALLAALAGDFLRRALSLPWIAAIGGMCYTLYLWHLFVMAAVLKLTLRLLPPMSYVPAMLLHGLVVVPVIFAVAIVLFLAIEKPCMEPDWAGKLLNRAGSSAHSPAPELHPASSAPVQALVTERPVVEASARRSPRS